MNTDCRNDKQAITFAELTAENGRRFQPFRWQMRLLDHFMAGDLPSVVDIPTGLGKTAVMALWLMARVAGAKVPRRLVYVVDRRAVVDQATRFAQRFRDNMTSTLAASLGLGEQGLPISTLRGGFADNREWLEDPSKPAIVVGTVDMVGSRLLFEGYGVSRGMRPYYAGFLGADTLVVLDEAHLCPPFEALLQDIAAHRDCKFGPTGSEASLENTLPPFRLMSLSATGRTPPTVSTSKSSEAVFRIQEQDLDEPLVGQRVSACKRLNLVEVEDPKTLPGKLAQCAMALGYGNPPTCAPADLGPGKEDPSVASRLPSRVLVYCNSRKDAVEVKTAIDKDVKVRIKNNPGVAPGISELLVGERRNHERGQLESWLEQHGFLGGHIRARRAVFLVATSAGEVGVDLDADHMVCDLVAYERMVQRLGRVNRRGGVGRDAQIEVVAVPPLPLPSNANEAKQKEHEAAVDWFNARLKALTGLPQGADGRCDASPRAIMQLRSCQPDVVECATTPAPLHPALTRPHLEAWAMTSLKQHEGRTEVAPWLRGWEEEEEPQMNVVWRKHLPCLRVGNNITVPKSLVTQFFQSAGIHATEKLEAPVGHVWNWLLKRVKQAEKRAEDHALHISRSDIVALVIDRANDLVSHACLNDLVFLGSPKSRLGKADQQRQSRGKRDWERQLAGRTLVVDSRLCGLIDGMLSEGSDAAVASADADEGWRGLREDARTNRPVIKFRVQSLNAEPDDEGLATMDLGDWRLLRTFETALDAGGSVHRGLAVYKWHDDPGDEDSRSILPKAQSLQDHAEQVAKQVLEIAERLGLPRHEVDALERAARFHDDGKAAQRWQDAMNAPKDGRPYAKTAGGGNWRQLEGYRHEFGSLLKAERSTLPTETQDLILHLIAAHHGYARPLITTSGCEDGPPTLLEAKAGDAALRFAQLQKRYGIWGLAWREAILRAADQRASRDFAASDSSDG